MIINAEEIKNKIFTLIGENDKGFENDEHFCYACGIAFMALLYIKNETNEEDNKLSNSVLYSPDFKQLKDKIVSLINQNLDYVENLPFYKKNLFHFITKYEPISDKLDDVQEEYLKLGTLNLNTFYELELIKISDYAKIHGMTPSAVRYHIYNKNLKTAQKAGRNWVIYQYEPYPESKSSKDI